MAAMVRKQIYISERQQALIERLATSLGVSQAEVVRRAIDRAGAEAGDSGFVSSEQAWEEAKAFMLSLDRRTTGREEPYRWTRDELYEQRGLSRDLRVSEDRGPDDPDRH